jgi:Tubulin like
LEIQNIQLEDRKDRVEELVKEQEIHRTGDQEGPFSIHVLGLGRTGASVIEQLLSSPSSGFLEDSRTRFSALAVDIGDGDLKPVRKAAKGAGLPEERTQVRTVDLGMPGKDDFFASLRRYREYLKIEYPRYYWNPNYEPWLPEDLEMPVADGHVPRAVSKGIYNREYYEDGPITQALDDFAKSINASKTVPIVFVVFGLAGGTGSGIAVDIARHLSSVKLGRRHIVVGVGVLPSSEGDPAETHNGVLFPVINEIDCMLDEEKNQGVQAVWGDLYRNPFTGGFFAVPQDGIFELTGDIPATNQYVDEGIASFIGQDNGRHIYETLKLLNWLNSPTDRMHPATRAPIGERWVNVLVSQKLDDAKNLSTSLGRVADGAQPEYVEARVFAPAGAFDAETGAKEIEGQITSAVTTLVEPDVVHFEVDNGSFVHVSVPRLTKLDLPGFSAARDAYDRMSWDEKLLAHSWLLDLGTMLCEPSTRFEGMAGECIWGCACWVVVPFEAVRGEEAGERVTS